MSDQVAVAAKDKLDGVEGWLLIPFFGLLVGAFDHSNTLFDHELPRAAVEILVGNLVMAIGSLVVFTLMCRKHAVLPMMIIVYAVTDLSFHALEYIATTTYLLDIDPGIAASEQPRVLNSLKTTIAFWAVFVPYFLVSERVKATFTDDA